MKFWHKKYIAKLKGYLFICLSGLHCLLNNKHSPRFFYAYMINKTFTIKTA